MSFIHSKNVRTEEQARVMAEIEEAKVCPFCPENLTTYHKKPIHEEGEHWILTENQWPYEGSKIHLFAIAKQHVDSLKDLPAEAGAELFELFKKWAEKLDIPGGTIAMRFGPNDKYASSVHHLHAHFIEPDVTDPNHQGVKFPISKPATPRT